jgi:endoglucanase
MSNNMSYLVDILNRKQKAQLQASICLWTGAVAIFFLWWFQPSHVAFNSFVLGWAIIMPAYYFYFLRRIKKQSPELPIPADWRVAMLSKQRIILCLLTSVLSNSIQIKAAERPPQLSPTVDLGVYDNAQTCRDVQTIAIEHIWYRWDRDNPNQLLRQIKSIAAKNRKPMITIEPYPIRSIGTDKTLLSDIAAGKYDATVKALAKEIKALDAPVIVRWGHEMECVKVYPWSERPVQDYIAAFRKVSTTLKTTAPAVQMLWSPVGNDNCQVYYPGDDFVDYTGFTVLEFPAMSVLWHGHGMAFAEWMNEKYPRVASFGKPVIVAELGVYDNPANQKAWVTAAFETVGNYPLVTALVYFNTRDSTSWAQWGVPGGLNEIPNWTINPIVFQK